MGFVKDYMDDIHGKEIDLQKTTIKIPGANKPRIGKSLLNLEANKLPTEAINSLNLNSAVAMTFTNGGNHHHNANNGVHCDLKGAISEDMIASTHSTGKSGTVPSSTGSRLFCSFVLGLTNGSDAAAVTANPRLDVASKKRHRRIKSNHKSDQNKEDEQEGFEFIIVSLDNKQWHFEAASNDEREEWVQAIEQQILSSLQTNETNKLKVRPHLNR